MAARMDRDVPIGILQMECRQPVKLLKSKCDLVNSKHVKFESFNVWI